MKKLEWILLGVILLCAFFTRLYRFDGPVADWHSWRQADTSSVSRNFVKNGFDLLHPTYQDLSNVPSGIDNPKGYRFVEFPIYNALAAGGFKTLGVFTLEEWGRIVSIISSLFSISFIYLILKNRGYKFSGFFAAFFYATLPFAVYYGRTILPDQTMVAASLGGTYFFDLWINSKLKTENLKLKTYFIFSLLLTATAFLLKPYALFFTLPIIYLTFEKFKFTAFKKWKLWLFLFVSVIPLILWRKWMQQFPEGIPTSDWLFNAGNIRFRPAFFRWIFFERISKLILGYFGVVFLILGFMVKIKKNDFLFFLSFAVSSIIYIFVIARGNVQHDYYQILIIPSIVIFLGLGIGQALQNFKKSPKGTSFPEAAANYFVLVALFTFLILMYVFSWNLVKDFFNINNSSIVRAGKEVDKLIPKNAKVIANYNGDTAFLYQTNRSGWASFEKPIPEMISMGAEYLLLINPSEKDLEIGKTYKIVKNSSDYVIFNLRQKP